MGGRRALGGIGRWGVGGRHVCLPKADPRLIFEAITREGVTLLCAAPTVLIGMANAPEDLRRNVPGGVRVLTAGAPPAAATIERMEGELGWDITHVYGLTEVSPIVTIAESRPEHAGLDPAARAVIKARQGVEYLANAEVRVVEKLETVPVEAYLDAVRDEDEEDEL